MVFQKGKSGNPKGLRPGTLLITPILRRKLKQIADGKSKATNLDVAIDNYVKEIKKGKPQNVEALIDRLEGRPRQSSEDPGTADNPLHLQVTIKRL